MMYGAIEAGGTKFVCAVGNEELAISKRVSFPTTTPAETMPQVIAFFKEYEAELQGIGVGSFGPIDIHRESPTYGHIMATPKLPWQNFDFIGYLKKYLPIPIAWTTDVNAACFGESVKGHGEGLNSLVYYTIGTGVGGGAMQQGRFIEGFSHPEMGHMLVDRQAQDDFTGACPFHGNCLEGMAAGPAIEKRLGRQGQTLPDDDPYWVIEADYLAQCVYNTTLMLSPEVIILGGGVMKQPQLIQLVRDKFAERLQGYVSHPPLTQYLVTPKLGDDAGVTGCLALARNESLRVTSLMDAQPLQ